VAAAWGRPRQIVLFVFSPKLAYNFSELIEAHAVDTYGEFADANEQLLKRLPPPVVAAQYYLGSDTYMFSEVGGAGRCAESGPSAGSNEGSSLRWNLRDLLAVGHCLQAVAAVGSPVCVEACR
jgi:hypothetical protein